jgi:hypothetical protein
MLVLLVVGVVVAWLCIPAKPLDGEVAMPSRTAEVHGKRLKRQGETAK